MIKAYIIEQLASLVVLGATLVAPSAFATSVEALANATDQEAGPRSNGNGLAFFNIEGSANGSFASYGVARFDLSAMKAGFDATYGAGGWLVDSVVLGLTQSNASFTTDGAVDVYFTDDDTTSITSGSSPLAYPFVGDFPDASKILGYTFTEISSGTLEQHGLFSAAGVNGVGALALAADILSSDNLVTLALVDADAAVAATYADYTHSTYTGPLLNVNVTAVP